MSIAINYINISFTGIFALEAMIKIIALDKRYFLEKWNVFDFIIALISLAGVIM
jgi:hypothetical protein